MRGHVLVVDDEDGPREALEFVLQRESSGWEVSTASDLESAQRLIADPPPEKGPVDVLLTDLVMGRDEAAGLKLVHFVQGRDPFLMVILFTAKSKTLDRMEALELGAFDCIEKTILGHLASRELIYKTRAALRFRQMALAHVESLRVAQQAQEELRKSQERYALAARGANDGLWDWDIEGGTIYFSPRWKSMLGYEEKEVGTNPDEWWRRVHEEDLEGLLAAIEDHLRGRTPQLVLEYRMRMRDGAVRWMLCRGLAVRDDEGKALRMAGSLTDVTDRRFAEEQLRHGALHDSLTGLPNRVLFLDRVEQAAQRGSRPDGSSFAVALMGMDRFKLVNESLGHDLGDQLLREVGARLENVLRSGDTAARHGGDQFGLLLERVPDVATVRELLRKVQDEVVRPIEAGGHELRLGVSFGVAFQPRGRGLRQGRELLRDADIALHRGKVQGRGRIEVFEETMRGRSLELLHLETDLRRALDQGELELFWQPIVRLTDGLVMGFEGLIRWRHPGRGLVSPGSFIEVAEETGLILPIGRWVMRTGLRQLRRWHDRYPYRRDLTISLNVSPRQLQDLTFVDQVGEDLDAAQVDASCFRIEITENYLIGDLERAGRTCNQLRALGLDLYIDDFGTGYSSIRNLTQLPFGALKIDRSFVEKLRGGPDDDSLVRPILELARVRGLKTIAEGVETLEQLSTLRELGCEAAQGYLFSEPIPSAKAEALIQAGRPV